MKFSLLVVGTLILSGCSSPATPEDIKAAIKECPSVKSFINYEIQECFGLTCRESPPLTKQKLNGLLDDCENRLKEEADPLSPENIIKAQRAAIAAE